MRAVRLSILDERKNSNFWEEPIAYFPVIRYGTHKNDASNNCSITAYVFVAVVTLLSICCLAKIGDTHTDTQTDGKDL
jgi:hypothetical protein